MPRRDPETGFAAVQPGSREASWDPERRVRAYRIPPLVLLATILALAVGELASGTELYFVAMMAIALVSIGITYNMLGGLSRISGFLFAAMAAATIVISQFAKVIFFEAADKNLEAPYLTISVYAVFYLSAMLGVFLFGWVRLRLPKPLEPATISQSRGLYWIALVVGIIANALLAIDTYNGTQSATSSGHSIGLAFSPLLLFSVVLAVDQRIRETDGRHSLNLRVMVPVLAVDCYQFMANSREGLASPILVYVLACYVRGYRFRARHYIGILAFVVLFQTVISPFELYAKRAIANSVSFRSRLADDYRILESPPEWKEIWSVQEDEQTSGDFDEYYSVPETFVLSRLSMIRADSDLIYACANGTRYGFSALKVDLLYNIPRLISKNKPDDDGAPIIQGIAGTPYKWAFTAISDSFGMFGWIGVVIFPLLILPMLFAVYDSMFDMGQPWGTVALGIGIIGIWDKRISDFFVLMIKDPMALWLLSFLTVWIARVVAGSGRSAERAGGGRLAAYPRFNRFPDGHPGD